MWEGEKKKKVLAGWNGEGGLQAQDSVGTWNLGFGTSGLLPRCRGSDSNVSLVHLWTSKVLSKRAAYRKGNWMKASEVLKYRYKSRSQRQKATTPSWAGRVTGPGDGRENLLQILVGVHWDCALGHVPLLGLWGNPAHLRKMQSRKRALT